MRCTAAKTTDGSLFTCHEELVPLVQHAVNNGRKLEQLMREAGLRYTVALKAKRAADAS